jgi:hypothetical protein
MTKNTQTKSLTPAKYTKLFGSAPVLSSEHSSEYEALLMHLDKCLQPRDFIEHMYLKDLADLTWEVKRYLSHKPLVIEREYLLHQEMEAKRRQKARRLQRDIAENMKAQKAKQAEQASGATSQCERAFELEAVVEEAVADVDEILLEPADEIDHAKALQSGIDYYERLDHLETVARARRDNVFRQIEFYRQGLGSLARRASDEIIDAEFSETRHEAPLITGADGEGAP